MTAPDWNAFRAEFPVFEHWAYLGWASVASLPRPVAMAMREQILGAELDGVSRFPEWYADATSARAEAAKLINAHSDEISLLKNTAIKEKVTVQFRAEFFNLFNHPNFGLPDNFVGSSSFGRVLSAESPRRIQFGVKLLY